MPLAGSSAAEVWEDSGTRRLDAVRFPADGAPQIVPFREDAAGFARRVAVEQAWLIEVKRKLTRGAIGQVIVGADLFWKQYGVAPARLIIVCEHRDSALDWVCERRSIDVASYDLADAPS